MTYDCQRKRKENKNLKKNKKRRKEAGKEKKVTGEKVGFHLGTTARAGVVGWLSTAWLPLHLALILSSPFLLGPGGHGTGGCFVYSAPHLLPKFKIVTWSCVKIVCSVVI